MEGRPIDHRPSVYFESKALAAAAPFRRGEPSSFLADDADYSRAVSAVELRVKVPSVCQLLTKSSLLVSAAVPDTFPVPEHEPGTILPGGKHHAGQCFLADSFVQGKQFFRQA